MIEPTIESAVTARRADLLTKLGNSVQASQEANVRKAVGLISEQAQNSRDLNTATVPVTTERGQNLDIKI